MSLPSAFHIHSIFSDGRATLDRLVEAAKRTGTKIVAVVDHDTVDNRSWMGWYKGCFILSGAEITLRNDQHIVAFGLERLPTPRAENAATVARFLTDKRTFSYIAHPEDPPCPPLSLKGYPFQEWKQMSVFNGIEIWSLASSAKGFTTNLLKGWQLYCRTASLLPLPGEEVLQKWDSACFQKPFYALCGLDEHSLPFKKLWLKGEIFGLEKSFCLLRNYLDVKEEELNTPERGESAILRCLREGRFYIAFDALAPAGGFSFEVKTEEGTFPMGGTARFREVAQLWFRLPVSAGVKILHNGVMMAFHSGTEFFVEVKAPGCYRAVVFHHGRPWIFSNPIWLTPSQP